MGRAVWPPSGRDVMVSADSLEVWSRLGVFPQEGYVQGSSACSAVWSSSSYSCALGVADFVNIESNVLHGSAKIVLIALSFGISRGDHFSLVQRLSYRCLVGMYRWFLALLLPDYWREWWWLPPRGPQGLGRSRGCTRPIFVLWETEGHLL